MKKYLALILGMLFVLGFAVSAFAQDKAEINLTGTLRIFGHYADDYDLGGAAPGTDNPDDKQAFNSQLFDLYATFKKDKVTAGALFRMRGQGPSTTYVWGTNNSHPGSPTGPNLGDTSIRIDVRSAYVAFPLGEVNFKIGRQNFVLSSDGEMVFGNFADGLLLSHKTGDITLYGAWVKAWESDDNAAAQSIGTTFRSGTESNNDGDAYVIGLQYGPKKGPHAGLNAYYGTYDAGGGSASTINGSSLHLTGNGTIDAGNFKLRAILGYSNRDFNNDSLVTGGDLKGWAAYLSATTKAAGLDIKLYGDYRSQEWTNISASFGVAEMKFGLDQPYDGLFYNTGRGSWNPATVIAATSNYGALGLILDYNATKDVSLWGHLGGQWLADKDTSLNGADDRAGEHLGTEIGLGLRYQITKSLQAMLSAVWYVPGDGRDAISETTGAVTTERDDTASRYNARLIYKF